MRGWVGAFVVVGLACSGAEPDREPQRSSSVNTVVTTGVSGTGGRGAIESAGHGGAAGMTAGAIAQPPVVPPPVTPPPFVGSPVAGAPPVAPPPAAAAGRGGGGMAAPGAPTAGMPAAGTAAAGSGSAGPCTMNLACKLVAAPSTGDIKQDCVDRINQFRTQCACMAPLERWTAGEGCADMMAQHDSETGKGHSGFIGNICMPTGFGQNECPGYPSETYVIGTCLQQMWSEGPPPMTPCEGQCFQTYGHFLNMTNKQFKRVACGVFKTTAGAVWAVQNFN